MSGSTTVNLTPGQTSFTTHASGVTINGSNITNGVVVNYCITDYGNFATIQVGNGDENIAACGTNNLIIIGTTPIEAA